MQAISTLVCVPLSAPHSDDSEMEMAWCGHLVWIHPESLEIRASFPPEFFRVVCGDCITDYARTQGLAGE